MGRAHECRSGSVQNGALNELSMMHRWTVGDCQALIGVLEQRIAALEAKIRRRALPDKRVAALQAIPGIGLLSDSISPHKIPGSRPLFFRDGRSRAVLRSFLVFGVARPGQGIHLCAAAAVPRGPD
jgi:hypothetical protein